MGVLYTNGEKVFEGEFKDGKMYEGTMYKKNGGKIVGIFKNDSPWGCKGNVSCGKSSCKL